MMILERLADLSIISSMLILCILIARGIIRKFSYRVASVLWIVVALRLIIPFSAEMKYAIFTDEIGSITRNIIGNNHEDIVLTEGAENVKPANSQKNMTESGNVSNQEPYADYFDKNASQNISIDTYNIRENPILTQDNEGVDLYDVHLFIWCTGIAVILAVALIRYIRLKKAVTRGAYLRTGENIVITDAFDSPFVMGILRPVIYVPSGLDPAEKEYVLAHEKTHIRMRHNAWKLLGYVLLAVYWLNPLVWVSYCIFCRDIEYACDEGTVKNMDVSERREYAKTLLKYSTKGRVPFLNVAAFGEIGVKGRVKAALNSKKVKMGLVFVTLILLVVFSFVFFGYRHNGTDENANIEVDGSNDEKIVVDEKIVADEKTVADEQNALAEVSDGSALGTTEDVGKDIKQNVSENVAGFLENTCIVDTELIVCDKFTAYTEKSIDSETFEVEPNHEPVELIDADCSEWPQTGWGERTGWIQFRWGERIGWVQYLLTDDPWVGEYLLNTAGEPFPLMAVWVVNPDSYAGPSKDYVNAGLYKEGINTSFEEIMQAVNTNGQGKACELSDITVTFAGEVDYFYNLKIIEIKKKSAAEDENSSYLLLALFDKTDTYLMAGLRLEGDDIEFDYAEYNRAPALAIRVFTLNDGVKTLKYSTTISTSTTIDTIEYIEGK